LGNLDSDVNYLEGIIKRLKEPIKRNSGKPLIVDDLTDKNIHTKYMGFCKYKENPVRRIDIRFVPYESFNSALLYFTGSADLNKEMRKIAKKKNLKLSEYGLFKENGDKLEVKSERDIFDILGLEYLHPRLR
jgi:DNA polymerase/3'-5' exonuclease PolX